MSNNDIQKQKYKVGDKVLVNPNECGYTPLYDCVGTIVNVGTEAGIEYYKIEFVDYRDNCKQKEMLQAKDIVLAISKETYKEGDYVIVYCPDHELHLQKAMVIRDNQNGTYAVSYGNYGFVNFQTKDLISSLIPRKTPRFENYDSRISIEDVTKENSDECKKSKYFVGEKLYVTDKSSCYYKNQATIIDKQLKETGWFYYLEFSCNSLWWCSESFLSYIKPDTKDFCVGDLVLFKESNGKNKNAIVEKVLKPFERYELSVSSGYHSYARFNDLTLVQAAKQKEEQKFKEGAPENNPSKEMQVLADFCDGKPDEKSSKIGKNKERRLQRLEDEVLGLRLLVQGFKIKDYTQEKIIKEQKKLIKRLRKECKNEYAKTCELSIKLIELTKQVLDLKDCITNLVEKNQF